MRYDSFVSKKLEISRNKALELIENKQIMLNQSFFKPAFDIKAYYLSLKNEHTKQELSQKELLENKALNLKLLSQLYVSRAAFKLEAFLKEVKLDIRGKSCLDIGSSTGGFVQVLLENEAKSVLALDVGAGQLHESLRLNSRVKSLENTDLRDFARTYEGQKFELITCDVSFISLLHLLAFIDKLANAYIILLFKPQFEVGKEAKRDKKGVLKDEKAINLARKSFEKACMQLGWLLQTSIKSSLKGKEGNVEYFYLYSKR
ncbi:TlyA family RNA methyltransferase [Campylobacter sp. MIT 19-121]|uniref:23S rRNA (cytidine-2'-O)-methyltransferase TlyA n=1 Tax=Campylobacter sp. MIT 19-121 TaxID=2703906 RepID=UPI00138A0CBA|nr:TlyA family RNA methyltransferase [Campylobacter sp. MIT 19-121]NDJ27864.1 TlyA family RNA methyltransferase [Campylobacter sp. MIT 19-121]